MPRGGGSNGIQWTVASRERLDCTSWFQNCAPTTGFRWFTIAGDHRELASRVRLGAAELICSPYNFSSY